MNALDVSSFRNRFNEARDSVRLVTIFSPTCLLCQYGQGLISELFEQVPETSLQGFSIWLPIMDADDAGIATLEAARFPTGRVEHFWDRERRFGELFAQTLGLKGVAWDVYMLYAPQVTWDTESPPPPTFWMHQLPPKTGADPRFLLAPGVLLFELMGLLGKTDDGTARDFAFTLHAKALGAVKKKRPQSSLEETLAAVDPETAGSESSS